MLSLHLRYKSRPSEFLTKLRRWSRLLHKFCFSNEFFLSFCTGTCTCVPILQIKWNQPNDGSSIFQYNWKPNQMKHQVFLHKTKPEKSFSHKSLTSSKSFFCHKIIDLFSTSFHPNRTNKLKNIIRFLIPFFPFIHAISVIF